MAVCGGEDDKRDLVSKDWDYAEGDAQRRRAQSTAQKTQAYNKRRVAVY
jgi:hypothetical protein